jgi:hypothetical protein
MTRIWKEPRTRGLLPENNIMVRVASFTFRFSSVQKLRDCLSYYKQKTHQSSRIPEAELRAEFGRNWRALRSWEIERWYERLPMYLLEEPKRQKVVKALTEALELAEAGKL